MANTVDERIVEAKFDSSDFEKGVDKTVKKLDELKKSLNLKDTGKSVTEFTKEASEGIEKSNKALDRLSERLTTFKGMIKQKILGGLADEVSNVFLGIERSIAGVVRSLSSDQMREGMNKYTEILNSVRTMTAAGIEESKAYEQIKRLAEYSDQTSYSLNQMTSGMSKLVAAGMEVSKAEKSMEGLANMCASAGVNIYDAQRAFLNFSQAYSSGTMKINDWMSFEALNMATENVMKVFMQAGEQVGTLTKTIKKDGTEVYKTVNKVNKQVKAGKEVSTKGFRDTLNFGWLDKKTMEQATAVLSYFEDLGVSVDKLSDEELKNFATKAFLAAKEARSFADVIGTVRDVVATGWATSFELIFGKLEEATKFFTWLSESNLAQAIYKVGEFRNTVLKAWGEAYSGVDEEGNLTGGVFVKGKTGRDRLKEALQNIDDLIGGITEGLGTLGQSEYNGVLDRVLTFPEKLGKNLGYATTALRDATAKIRDFFTEVQPDENGDPQRILRKEFLEPLEKIRDVASGAIGIVKKLWGIATDAIGKAGKALTPVLLGIANAIGTMLSPIADLNENEGFFNSIKDAINNVLKVAQPLLDVLPSILGFLGQVGSFFVGMAIDTVAMNIQFFADALGFFMELFGVNSSQLERGQGVLEGIKTEFEGIKEACTSGLDVVKEFMSSLISDLKALFGLTESEEGSEKGGVFENLKNFFETNEFVQNAKAWVNQAITDVTNFIKSIPTRVKQLGANIYETLYGLFFKEVQIGKSPKNKETVLTPLGEWLNKAIQDIKAWFAALPGKIIAGVGKITDWISDVIEYWFGKRSLDQKASAAGIQDETNPIEKTVRSRFDAIVATVKSNIIEWFRELPKKIQNGMKSIGDFGKNIQSAIEEFFFGKDIIKTNVRKNSMGQTFEETYIYHTTSGLQQLLINIWDKLAKFINNIPNYIKSAIKGTGDIVTVLLNALFGKKPGDKENPAEIIENKFQEAFKGLNLSGVFSTIKDIGKEILNQLLRLFTGSEDFNFNTEWLSGKVAEGISHIQEKASDAWENVVKPFLVSIPSKIAGIFNGEGQESGTAEQNPIQKALIDFANTIGGFISDIPLTLANMFNNAITEIDKAWTNFYNGLTTDTAGEAEKAVEKVQASTYPNAMAGDKRYEGKSKWELFIDGLGKAIKNAINNLPHIVVEAVDLAIKAIDAKLKELTDWIASKNAEEEIAQATAEAKEEAKGAAEEVAASSVKEIDASAGKGLETAEKQAESPFTAALQRIGGTLQGLIITTVPDLIKKGWEFIVKKVTDFGKTIFDTIKSDDFQDTVKGLGEKIRDAVLKLPEHIADAFKTVSTIVKSLFSNEDTLGVEEGMGEAEKKAVETVKEKKDEIAKELGKEGESGSFFEELGQSMLNAFKSVGPAVLNGLSSAFDWLADIGSKLADIISGKVKLGDIIKKHFGEDNPELADSLLRFGDSIKLFFTNTLPDLIGASIGSLLTNSKEWFSKLFEGLNKSMEEAERDTIQENGEKKADPMQSAIDFVSNFINMITSKLGGNEVVTALACIVAITGLISAVRGLFDIGTDVAEAAKDTVKWAAIALGISAIASILSFVNDIAKSGETAKMEFANSVLDKLGNLAEKIAWIMGLFAASKGMSALGDVFGGKGKASVNPLTFLATGIGNAVTSIITGFGEAFGFSLAGEAVLGVAEDATESLGEMFTTVSESANDMLGQLVPFIDSLVALNDRLDTAIGTVNKFKDLFAALYNSFGEIYYTAMGNEKKQYDNALANAVAGLSEEVFGTYSDADTRKGLDAFAKDLESRVDTFYKLSVFLDTLASSVNKLQNVEDVGSQLDKVMAVMGDEKTGTVSKMAQFMTQMFNILDTAYGESNFSAYQFGEFFDPDTYNAIAMGIQIISSALSAFGSGISGFTPESVSYLQQTLDVFNNLALAFSESKFEVDKSGVLKHLFGDNSLAALGKQIKVFGQNIEPFAQIIAKMPGFGSESETKQTQDKLKAVEELGQKMAEVCVTLSGAYKMGNFELLSGQLEKYGGHIFGFISRLNTDLSGNKMSTDMLTNAKLAVDIFTSIGNMVANMAAVDTHFISNSPTQIIQSIVDAINSVTMVNSDTPLAEALKAISDAVGEDFNIQPQITPVVDMTNVNEAAQRLAELGFGKERRFVKFDVMGLTANANEANPANIVIPEPIDYSGYLRTIASNTASTVAACNRIPGSMGGMSIKMDTGALVGSLVGPMSEALGREQFYSDR